MKRLVLIAAVLLAALKRDRLRAFRDEWRDLNDILNVTIADAESQARVNLWPV